MTQFSLSKNIDPWDGFLREAPGASAKEYLPAFEGKRILVTGAGGFIGSALARSLASCPVETLLLMDNAEHGLYLLDQEIPAGDSYPDYRIIVGSVCDQSLLTEVFTRHRPHIVFHAAALKHVQLMETNPFAAVEVNTIGTEIVVRNAAIHSVEQLILVSTDKAVDPISVMGASKRLAELVVLSYSSSTQMKALRLCNVLGSTGSVAPLFQRQLTQGLPLTLTHREATRFFISIDRTVACLLATAGQHCRGIFVPEVGAAYRIEELARFMVEKCMALQSEIIYTGLRNGDKLRERMTSSLEQCASHSHADLITMVESPHLKWAQLETGLQLLREALATRDLRRLIGHLRELVPEYAAGEWLHANASPTGAESR